MRASLFAPFLASLALWVQPSFSQTVTNGIPSAVTNDVHSIAVDVDWLRNFADIYFSGYDYFDELLYDFIVSLGDLLPPEQVAVFTSWCHQYRFFDLINNGNRIGDYFTSPVIDSLVGTFEEIGLDVDTTLSTVQTIDGWTSNFYWDGEDLKVHDDALLSAVGDILNNFPTVPDYSYVLQELLAASSGIEQLSADALHTDVEFGGYTASAVDSSFTRDADDIESTTYSIANQHYPDNKGELPTLDINDPNPESHFSISTVNVAGIPVLSSADWVPTPGGTVATILSSSEASAIMREGGVNVAMPRLEISSSSMPISVSNWVNEVRDLMLLVYTWTFQILRVAIILTLWIPLLRDCIVNARRLSA